MAAVLTRTHPGTDLHMGALLRDALTRHGVTSVRVDKPWPSLPNEYLVAEVPGRAPVWIHAASCNGATHYDIPRGELMAVAAVVTDERNTRFVYDGFSDDNTRPRAQAETCAEAVAAFLGVQAPEPQRECLHCGRRIEWIEADGQGAWYDSSNRTGCMDGTDLHAPAPRCWSCEDTGVIEIFHASTDALIGHRPCDDRPCVKRRTKAAAEAQAERARAEAEAEAHAAVCTPQCCPPF
ncbi:hypothetical protein PUR49_08095 [Streptomyces sp. BE147]|uniref:hypothetical protein n=1 Tax=Streptomyces sp. BE147 TaxID=3002524 RepID=UPI002E77DF5A|nr:hypothetical protein [Streptomyces sp. BE147]MEE1736459.1 hypothetical protein [Streptomyces sp. BE147]